MPIINNLSEISDVYIGSEKITDVYAGNDKVKSGQQELPWTQPILSADGTIGGNSFACAGSDIYGSGYEAWRAFDNNTSKYAYLNAPPQWLEWYNPNPLKISKIIIKSGNEATMANGNSCIKNYKIQASTDNNNWIDIYTGTNSTKSSKRVAITANISSENFYKYWRIYVSSVLSGSHINIWDVTITATQLA